LIEVLVALVVVAFGISAALAALSSAADNASRLRDKTCAQWIGFNQIATTRLLLQAPAVGTTNGELDYAQGHWVWQQMVEETKELPGVQRLTVKVKRTGEPGSGAVGGSASNSNGSGNSGKTDDQGGGDWLATTIGFRGTTLSAANGEFPDWNGPRANQPPGGGRGGAGAGSGGDGTGTGSGPGDGSGPGPPGGRGIDPPPGGPR
jgi:type II secretion system protein I